MTLHRCLFRSKNIVHQKAAATATASSNGTSTSFCCPTQLARTLDWNNNNNKASYTSTGGVSSSAAAAAQTSLLSSSSSHHTHHDQYPPSSFNNHQNRTSSNSSSSNSRSRQFPVSKPIMECEMEDNSQKSGPGAAASILSLSIGSDRIDWAIAQHPSVPSVPKPSGCCNFCEEDEGERTRSATDIRILPSIPLLYQQQPSTHQQPAPRRNRWRRKAVCPSVTTNFWNLVGEFNVCGLLVAWPVQRDNGRCGAACGHVLHTLDQWRQQRSLLFPPFHNTHHRHHHHHSHHMSSSSSPLWCLYDMHQIHSDEDEWGRSAAHARTPPRHVTRHVTSTAPFNNDNGTHDDDDDEPNTTTPNIIPVQQWLSFSKTHWPELAIQESSPTSSLWQTRTKTNIHQYPRHSSVEQANPGHAASHTAPRSMAATTLQPHRPAQQQQQKQRFTLLSERNAASWMAWMRHNQQPPQHVYSSPLCNIKIE